MKYRTEGNIRRTAERLRQMANGNQSRIERINRTEARYLANVPLPGGIAKATNIQDMEEKQRRAAKGSSNG